MVSKKRLIFTLLYDNGAFMMSRNFRLQRVGDLAWLMSHYKFDSVANAIDELIVLDVSSDDRDKEAFCRMLSELTERIFMPVAAGGGIDSFAHAERLLKSGADKLVINTKLHEEKEFVKELIKLYGSQCIIGSVDYKKSTEGYTVHVNQGKTELKLPLKEYLTYVENIGIGELYLNSIDQDGTGKGYDEDIPQSLLQNKKTPVILAGGAGNYAHMLHALTRFKVEAVATANLLNFIGDGLQSARYNLRESGIDLASW